VLLVAAVAAGLLMVPAVGAAAGNPCEWPVPAPELFGVLSGRLGAGAALSESPALPAECAPVPAAAPVATPPVLNPPALNPQVLKPPTPAPASTGRATNAPAPATPAQPQPTARPRPATPPAPARPSGGNGVTAAATFGWGSPVRQDDFTGPLAGWDLYDGPGHAGNGVRSPAAATVAGGVLTIRGDAKGTTDGMAWNTGQKYGRWEGRVRAPASDPSYNALLLLWPDAENYPVGGEIDFMEMTDNTRQSTNLYLHHGAEDDQEHGLVKIDATQWHNWAVEWTPKGVTTYVDGKPWWHTADASILPPGPMHLCIQLDWFPGKRDGAVRPSQMQVDWVRQYAV
jgi:hypothetical protein